MMQRGRKSAVAFAVATHDELGQSRLMAPKTLSAAERGIWMAMVQSRPADWFGFEHVPIMVEYVKVVCRAAVIDQQLQAFTDEWLATEDGLARYEKLNGLAIKCASLIARLATTMRMTQQSVHSSDKVVPKIGNKIWHREPS